MINATRMRWLRSMALMLVLLLTLTACAPAPQPEATSATTVPTSTAAPTPTPAATAAGERAAPSQKPETNEAGNPLMPEFTLPSRSGEQISLSDFEGKLIVMNFWASWCPPCRSEMPDLYTLDQELQDQGDAVLLSINLTDGQRETRDKANAYLEDNGLNFSHVLYDEQGLVYGMFGLDSVPFTVVIDKEGYLASYILGAASLDTFREMIKEVA